MELRVETGGEWKNMYFAPNHFVVMSDVTDEAEQLKL
jgi:hypothetical protein